MSLLAIKQTKRFAEPSWSSEPFFFCERQRPDVRLPSGGPRAVRPAKPVGPSAFATAWRISGGKISSMQTDWAAFEVNGEQHVFHRRPTPTTFMLPWRRSAP